MITRSPAASDASQGIVNLATGDVRIPLATTVPASEATLDDASYPPVAGLPALRAAIALAVRAEGMAVDPGDILVTPGARMAILAALEYGRPEVLLPTPYWASYPELIRLAGGIPVPVGERLDFAQLDEVLTPRTGALILNSPRNPDGATLTPEEIVGAVTWAEMRDLTVVFDQVYRGIQLSPARTASIVDSYAQLPEHVVIVDGLTKSYALAGLRIGWLLATGDRGVQAAALASHLLGGVCMPAQRAAVAVLTEGDRRRAQIVAQVRTNLDRGVEALQALPGVVCERPAAGFFLFPDLRPWLAGSAPLAARTNVATWLREAHGVDVVNGAAFGAPGRIRLSVAVPFDDLVNGLARLSGALSARAPSSSGREV